MNQENYKTQIEDFRDLKPYYDLVFENMTSVSQFSFRRGYKDMTDALKEMITNAPGYISITWDKEALDAEGVLDLIDEEYSKLYTDKFYVHGKLKSLTTQQELEFEKMRDDYLKFIRKLRIRIGLSMTASGFLPRTQNVKPKQSEIEQDPEKRQYYEDLEEAGLM